MAKVIYINLTTKCRTADVSVARRWIEAGDIVTAAPGL